VIDCDGGYNESIAVAGVCDGNHPDEQASRRWVEICDSLADKICQPTLRPLQRNVRPFLFHAYNPAADRPLEVNAKEYGTVYVGNNWFRWRALHRFLRAIEPVRQRLGRIALVGEGWDVLPERYEQRLFGVGHVVDPDYLAQLAVEVLPPVRFD